MTLKIRLRQQGRTNRLFYRFVVADSRSPRDGKYVEMVGWYNPLEQSEEKNTQLREDRIEHWLNVGAQPSEKAEDLLKRALPQLMKTYQDKATEKRAKQLAKRKVNKGKKGAQNK